MTVSPSLRDEIIAQFQVDPSTGLYFHDQQTQSPVRKDELSFNLHTATTSNHQLLHELFGHASADTLSKLFGRKITLQPCTACAEGKMRQKKHLRRIEHEHRLMAQLHSDLVYAGVRSIDGALYFCTVLDEASRYLWIILLRSKKSLHEHLIPLIKREQRKMGVDVVRLTSDGGKEYASKNMVQFMLEEGLDQRIIPRYEHASNGMIETVNQRVTEIALVLLFASGLSIRFWSFSVAYAALIYNMLPHASLSWKSPHVQEIHWSRESFLC
jgi:hypothetical protein